MAKRLTGYTNGLQIGEGSVGNNGICMRLVTAEPSGNIFSKGETYSNLVKAGGTYASLWAESDGLHYNVNGTERTIPLTSTSGSNSLDIAYNVGSTITVDGGAVALTDPTTGSTDTLTIAKTSTNTGDGISIDLDAGVGARAINIDAGGGARTNELIAIQLDGTFSSASGGTVLDLDISQTGAAASSAIDIDVSSIFTGSIIDIAIGAAATTGYAINYDMNLGVAYGFMNIDCGAGVQTADIIDVTFDGSGNIQFLDVAHSNTGTANFIDIDVSGIGSGDILNITYSAASTGDAVVLDMTSAVAASAINIVGAGARTDDLIKIDDASTGSGAIMDINMTGVYTGNCIDISSAAAMTGNIINIDMDANLAGNAIYIDNGAGARTANLIETKFDGAGNVSILTGTVTNTGSGALIDLNVDGVHTGNGIDITYGSAASTGNAIDLNMGTNVAGMALSIGSAATGAASEGAAIDVNHTGALAANADLMRLVSSGSHNAASNLLYIEGSGASAAGTYALNINASGTNIEALKVDAGGVVFDETLAVAGATTMTGTLTVGVDNTGLDVKFFGATASAYMLWDESEDDLILAGAAGLSVAGVTTLTGAVTATAGVQSSAVARTGTDTGATTGQIAAGTAFVDLTSADANKVVGLPQCVLGNIIYIKKNTAEAFEIRPLVADKATTTINGGTCSSDEELTIASGLTAVCTCTKGGASGTWVVHTISANGTVAAGGAPA